MQPAYWVTLCILWYVIIYRQMQKKKFIKNRHKNRKGGIKEMEEIIKKYMNKPVVLSLIDDGFDNAVSFEYEGEVELMVYEEYAVRSASAGRGMISKNPFSLVRK